MLFKKQVFAEFTTISCQTVLENYTTFRKVNNSFRYQVSVSTSEHRLAGLNLLITLTLFKTESSRY